MKIIDPNSSTGAPLLYMYRTQGGAYGVFTGGSHEFLGEVRKEGRVWRNNAVATPFDSRKDAAVSLTKQFTTDVLKTATCTSG